MTQSQRSLLIDQVVKKFQQKYGYDEKSYELIQDKVKHILKEKTTIEPHVSHLLVV